MDISKATCLRIGQQVHFPADRGQSAGWGRVESVGSQVYKNMHGTRYVWVVVNHFGHNAVWPSNRLS